tara:strand:- start:258 stop:470 length:213 start_codon:yes stop_codon:yes gene_type:complete
MDDIRKNGVPLTDTEYQLGSLQEMTKEELIEEILGTHSWDYLLENRMVVHRNVVHRDAWDFFSKLAGDEE